MFSEWKQIKKEIFGERRKCGLHVAPRSAMGGRLGRTLYHILSGHLDYHISTPQLARRDSGERRIDLIYVKSRMERFSQSTKYSQE